MVTTKYFLITVQNYDIHAAENGIKYSLTYCLRSLRLDVGEKYYDAKFRESVVVLRVCLRYLRCTMPLGSAREAANMTRHTYGSGTCESDPSASCLIIITGVPDRQATCTRTDP